MGISFISSNGSCTPPNRAQLKVQAGNRLYHSNHSKSQWCVFSFSFRGFKMPNEITDWIYWNYRYNLNGCLKRASLKFIVFPRHAQQVDSFAQRLIFNFHWVTTLQTLLSQMSVCFSLDTTQSDSAEAPHQQKNRVLLCKIPMGAKRYCIRCVPGVAAGREFISSNSEHRGFVLFVESSLNACTFNITCLTRIYIVITVEPIL